MVSQRRVAVVILELHSHQPDEFRALDRLRRIGGKNLRQNLPQLFTKAHGLPLRMLRTGESVKEEILNSGCRHSSFGFASTSVVAFFTELNAHSPAQQP